MAWRTKGCTRENRSGARFGAQKVPRENTLLEHDLEHKKLHAKTPFWSTIWSTKSCTRKDPSGARSGPQKVAREKTHLEHDLEHEKLHAKRPIWSMIWSTKSCKNMARNSILFCKMILCSVQFLGCFKKVGNLYNQFFNLSIVNCVEWPQ